MTPTAFTSIQHSAPHDHTPLEHFQWGSSGGTRLSPTIKIPLSKTQWWGDPIPPLFGLFQWEIKWGLGRPVRRSLLKCHKHEAISPHMDQSTLFQASDHEINDGHWVMPALPPPASPDLTPPQPGSRCSACGCSSVWSEVQGRRFGWRCCCRHLYDDCRRPNSPTEHHIDPSMRRPQSHALLTPWKSLLGQQPTMTPR